MKIGIDFDNTIACYDLAFYVAAREREWVSDEIPATKEAVKNALCARGRNDDWTELQGYVYGPGIKSAEVFPGFHDFLIWAHARGWELFVISHKTKYPFRGPQYDLHGAAQLWVEESGLLSVGTGLTRKNLNFETTKEAKLRCATALQVDVFVDDLPEILDHPAFPPTTRPILFDPKDNYPTSSYRRLRNWSEAGELILDLHP